MNHKIYDRKSAYGRYDIDAGLRMVSSPVIKNLLSRIQTEIKEEEMVWQAQ